VSNIFTGASVFNAFSVAKDVVTDFIGSVTSGGKSQRDEELEVQRNKISVVETMERPVVKPPSAEPVHINPYNTRRAVQLSQKAEMDDSSPQPSAPSSVQSPSTSTGCYRTEMDRSTGDDVGQMDDSDYVTVSSVDQTRQESFTREWRKALLTRLGGICYQIAQCNHECATLLQWRGEWLRARAALDFESMRPFSRKSMHQIRTEHRQHEADEIQLKTAESHRWDGAFASRNQLLAWNREALQLNLSLVTNPLLDQRLWLQSVAVSTDQNGFMTIAMDHSHQTLVVPGQYYSPMTYQYLVQVAQRD